MNPYPEIVVGSPPEDMQKAMQLAFSAYALMRQREWPGYMPKFADRWVQHGGWVTG
jgi:hypothetical protein